MHSKYNGPQKPNTHLVINQTKGNPMECHIHPNRKPQYVAHVNIQDTEEYTGRNKGKVQKYSKICDEVFLCGDCWELDYYLNDARYDDGGVADFTSLYIRDYHKKSFTYLKDL